MSTVGAYQTSVFLGTNRDSHVRMDLPGTLLPRSDKTFRTVIRMKRIINNGYPLKDDRFVAFDANVAFLYGVEGADRTNTVLLLYIKYYNKHPIEEGHANNVLAISDTAGYFKHRVDAQNVADCLNTLIPLNQVNGKYRRTTIYYVQVHDRLYAVRAWYEAVGNFAPHEHVSEIIVSVATTKQKLNYKKANSFFQDDGDNPDILVEGPFIKRYVVNDVMPTMHLDDYDLTKHKERLKTVLSGLMDVPWTKQNRQDLRRAARAMPQHISYVDSSDSEDESNYKKTSARSLRPMLTPLPRQSKRLRMQHITNPTPIRLKKRTQPQPSFRRSKRLNPKFHTARP